MPRAYNVFRLKTIMNQSVGPNKIQDPNTSSSRASSASTEDREKFRLNRRCKPIGSRRFVGQELSNAAIDLQLSMNEVASALVK